MFSRLLVYLATLLLGSLFIEISMYHPSIAMERDPVTIVPAVTSAIALFGGFFFLAFAGRAATFLFVLTCCMAIVVGLVGTAIHLAIHAPSFGVLATDPHAWLGNPPTLAPLSFSVGGCLGLCALVWRDAQAVAPMASRLLQAAAAGAGLAAALLALQPRYGDIALVVVIASLALGSLGYASEALPPLVRRWASRPGRGTA